MLNIACYIYIMLQYYVYKTFIRNYCDRKNKIAIILII